MPDPQVRVYFPHGASGRVGDKGSRNTIKTTLPGGERGLNIMVHPNDVEEYKGLDPNTIDLKEIPVGGTEVRQKPVEDNPKAVGELKADVRPTAKPVSSGSDGVRLEGLPSMFDGIRIYSPLPEPQSRAVLRYIELHPDDFFRDGAKTESLTIRFVPHSMDLPAPHMENAGSQYVVNRRLASEENGVNTPIPERLVQAML